MSRYNQEAFTPEEVKKDKHLKLLKTLFELEGDTFGDNTEADKAYDIHIWTDGYCLIVEWCDKWFDSSIDSGHFEFVDENQVVLQEVLLPDNSTVYAIDDDDAKRLLKEFLEENPQWHKNQWGMWTDDDGHSPMYEQIKNIEFAKEYSTTSASTSDEPITIGPIKWEGDPVIYNEKN